MTAPPITHLTLAPDGAPAVGVCLVTLAEKPTHAFVRMTDPDWHRKLTCPLCKGAMGPAERRT